MALRFGDFTLIPGSRTLLRLGQLAHLTTKTFSFLEVLIERRPEPVSKPELSRLIWPDTVVTEGNLSNLAHELRRALNDDRGVYLRTIHGFGYAFIGNVDAVTEAPHQKLATHTAFRVVMGDRPIGLLEGENWIGRSTDCRVQVDSSRASRHHARIVVAGDRAILEDGPSRNGTFLCGKMLTKPMLLKIGDEITIGSACMTFRFVNRDTPTDA